MAAAAIRTPLQFASDISHLARAIAIDGSLELIERGYHREAMFWVAVTHSRCQKILSLDSPNLLAPDIAGSYRKLIGDLGLSTPAAIRQRCAEVEGVVPRVSELAANIIAASELLSSF